MPSWSCLQSVQATKFAIVTMVSSKDYVVGANVLLYSLRKYMDPEVLPLICFIALFIEGKANDGILANLASGWQPCLVS